MERPVKERLVGAAILVAAAIVLIPEMLSGPEHTAAPNGESSVAVEGEAPLKTYVIDLSQAPGNQAAALNDDTRAPPPEEGPALASEPDPAEPLAQDEAPQSRTPPDTATRTDSPASLAATQRGSEPAASVSPAAAATEPPAAATPAPARTALRSPTTRPAAPTSGGWAVQLGSFSKVSTAEVLMKQARARGFDAFVMPVRSGGTTLYRVRVGPMANRPSAEAALSSIRVLAPGAAVVTHP